MKLRPLIPALTAAALAFSMPSISEEGYMCNYYYKNVQRAEKNIKAFGDELSVIAKNKLHNDLRFATKQCISQCEERKFRYCNDISKWIAK